MELKDRIAAVRKAAGLTQEQLGELLGVTRQAVSKWESGQTTPDAATIAALCEKLHVSADYVLLGKEPGEGQTAAYEPPDTCPCCGRKVSGSICPECGYQLPNHPPRGPQYAVVATRPGFVQSTESSAQLVKYCGFTQEDANNAIAHYVNNQSRILLRRGLVDSAAQYIAAHPTEAETALDLFMVTKYLERLGDHAVNVAEWVEFLKTGVHKSRKIV